MIDRIMLLIYRDGSKFPEQVELIHFIDTVGAIAEYCKFKKETKAEQNKETAEGEGEI